MSFGFDDDCSMAFMNIAVKKIQNFKL